MVTVQAAQLCTCASLKAEMDGWSDLGGALWRGCNDTVLACLAVWATMIKSCCSLLAFSGLYMAANPAQIPWPGLWVDSEGQSLCQESGLSLILHIIKSDRLPLKWTAILSTRIGRCSGRGVFSQKAWWS